MAKRFDPLPTSGGIFLNTYVMAKDPAVLFYTSDFLSGTFTMTDEQVGKYIRLLCLQHQKGKLTEKDMLSICKAYDEDVYSKFVNENGFFYNERMFLESERRKKYSDSRRKNAQHTESQSKNKKAYAKHMETVTETITENENRNKDENFGKSENLLIVPEMLRIFKNHNPNYLSSESKDYRPLFSIASYLCEVGKLSGSPDLHRDQVLEAWEPICKVIKADKFYSQKSLVTISNHIQEILQISLHGKSTDNKPNYGSKERAKEYDRLFAERYGKG